MKDLRSQLTRLAYRKPELRRDLLPLLKTAVSKTDGKDFVKDTTDFVKSIVAKLNSKLKGFRVRERYEEFHITDISIENKQYSHQVVTAQIIAYDLHNDPDHIEIEIIIEGPFIKDPKTTLAVNVQDYNWAPDANNTPSSHTTIINGDKIGIYHRYYHSDFAKKDDFVVEILTGAILG